MTMPHVHSTTIKSVFKIMTALHIHIIYNWEKMDWKVQVDNHLLFIWFYNDKINIHGRWLVSNLILWGNHERSFKGNW